MAPGRLALLVAVAWCLLLALATVIDQYVKSGVAWELEQWLHHETLATILVCLAVGMVVGYLLGRREAL